MASTKLVFLAVAVLLLQASWWAMSQQAAVMAVTTFEVGGPAACDGQYHNDKDLLVAMSTQWYAGGSRCFKQIIITNSQQTEHTAVATVVDECDSESGCEDNIIAATEAVWLELSLGPAAGEVPITWADA